MSILIGSATLLFMDPDPKILYLSYGVKTGCFCVVVLVTGLCVVLALRSHHGLWSSVLHCGRRVRMANALRASVALDERASSCAARSTKRRNMSNTSGSGSIAVCLRNRTLQLLLQHRLRCFRNHAPISQRPLERFALGFALARLRACDVLLLPASSRHLILGIHGSHFRFNYGSGTTSTTCILEYYDYLSCLEHLLVLVREDRESRLNLCLNHNLNFRLILHVNLALHPLQLPLLH